MLRVVDRLDITILVDNVTDNLSSVPSFVETELSSHWKRGMRLLSGKCLCCAAHGLSCLITAHAKGSQHTLLFDTGPEEWVFERNITRLGADLAMVDAMLLSHGHWDHAGAMPRALQIISQLNGGRDVLTYMHPGMFRTRALKGPDGSMRLMEDVPSVAELTQNGAKVICTTEPQIVLEGSFFISGEIPRRTSFERGFPGQHRRTEDGQGWEPDELLMDERFLAVNVSGKGLIVFSACSHAGVVNVLHHARECFPEMPIHAVLGGFHLSGSTETVIPETVEGLREFELKVIAAAHCTGWRAVAALAAAFGQAVVPRKRYTF